MAGNTVALGGSCSAATVNAPGNTIHIGAAKGTVVNGAGNQIAPGGSPEITSGDHVWRSRPEITVNGLGNHIMLRQPDRRPEGDVVRDR